MDFFWYEEVIEIVFIFIVFKSVGNSIEYSVWIRKLYIKLEVYYVRKLRFRGLIIWRICK